ncbi:MAG: DUF354 domain-containing protein [Melioribacteraceae bacterium]|nr:DUF354 domain-containing protein [Melioribacteraceae bacterium]
MKILFHLAHPAHFHLFKNVIKNLISKEIYVRITYNDKDILDELINESEFKAISRKLKSRKKIVHKSDLILQFLEKSISLYKILKQEKPSLVIGTSIIISLASKPLGISNIIVNEDDFDIIQQTANLGYRFATKILCPDVCRTGRWDFKCVKYNSYHELAYLHPNHFEPNKKVVEKYFNMDDPFFVLRFAKLSAHHDEGIEGINDKLALEIVNRLRDYGKVFITTERDIGESLNTYRLLVNPFDMHHLLAYTKLYIGDSQTMAAEAGVLGTPFIRINDFVGRISYLDELENKYKLGWGIKPNEGNKLFDIIDSVISKDINKTEWEKRREIMLSEKLDYAVFLSDFIENYINE